MKINELLTEQTKGTYAGVRFDTATNKALHDYVRDNKIPTAVRPDRFHTTLLYSRKYLPNYKAAGKISPPWFGAPQKDFVVWETQDKASKCLILKFDCPQLEKRHKELMKEHEATYDYPKYETHITLSYDIGDLDVKSLPPITDWIKKIAIVEEYQEDLDIDWAKNKGTKKG